MFFLNFMRLEYEVYLIYLNYPKGLSCFYDFDMYCNGYCTTLRLFFHTFDSLFFNSLVRSFL